MLLSSDLRPSGSVNTIRGPKQVILVALGDGWVEQSHLGVCSPSANYLGSKLLFLFICDFILYLYLFRVVFTKFQW